MCSCVLAHAQAHISCTSNFCVTLSRAHRTRARVVHLAQKTLPTSTNTAVNRGRERSSHTKYVSVCLCLCIWEHYEPRAPVAHVVHTTKRKYKHTLHTCDGMSACGVHAVCGSTHLSGTGAGYWTSLENRMDAETRGENTHQNIERNATVFHTHHTLCSSASHNIHI